MVWKVLERILTSVLLSLIMAFLSFSFFTGKFPPKKDDIFRAIKLSRQMISGTKEFNAAAQDMQAAQQQGHPPSLEQMAEFQRLALKRTEVTIELMTIFNRFKTSPPSDQIGEKLQLIASHMGEVEKQMGELNVQLQQATGGGQ